MGAQFRTHVAANRRRYARVAHLYDVLDSVLETHYLPGRALIGSRACGLTLELGAGTGKNFAYYEEPARVFASDLSEAMLRIARRRLHAPVRSLLAAEVDALPFRSAIADTVTATFVCCVQDDPRPSIAEMARVLKPGGRVLCLDYTVPSEAGLRLLMRLLEPLLHVVYGIHWEHDIPGLLQAAGLRVSEVRSIWGPTVRYIEAERPRETA